MSYSAHATTLGMALYYEHAHPTLVVMVDKICGGYDLYQAKIS